jgi:hypothetical protein
MFDKVVTRMVNNEEAVSFAAGAGSGIGVWLYSKSRNQPEPGAHNGIGVFSLLGRLHLI